MSEEWKPGTRVIDKDGDPATVLSMEELEEKDSGMAIRVRKIGYVPLRWDNHAFGHNGYGGALPSRLCLAEEPVQEAEMSESFKAGDRVLCVCGSEKRAATLVGIRADGSCLIRFAEKKYGWDLNASEIAAGDYFDAEPGCGYWHASIGRLTHAEEPAEEESPFVAGATSSWATAAAIVSGATSAWATAATGQALDIVTPTTEPPEFVCDGCGKTFQGPSQSVATLGSPIHHDATWTGCDACFRERLGKAFGWKRRDATPNRDDFFSSLSPRETWKKTPTPFRAIATPDPDPVEDFRNGWRQP